MDTLWFGQHQCTGVATVCDHFFAHLFPSPFSSQTRISYPPDALVESSTVFMTLLFSVRMFSPESKGWQLAWGTNHSNSIDTLLHVGILFTSRHTLVGFLSSSLPNLGYMVVVLLNWCLLPRPRAPIYVSDGDRLHWNAQHIGVVLYMVRREVTAFCIGFLMRTRCVPITKGVIKHWKQAFRVLNEKKKIEWSWNIDSFFCNNRPVVQCNSTQNLLINWG